MKEIQKADQAGRIQARPEAESILERFYPGMLADITPHSRRDRADPYNLIMDTQPLRDC